MEQDSLDFGNSPAPLVTDGLETHQPQRDTETQTGMNNNGSTGDAVFGKGATSNSGYDQIDAVLTVYM